MEMLHMSGVRKALADTYYRFVLLSAGNNNTYPTIAEVQVINNADVNVARDPVAIGFASSIYNVGAVHYDKNGPLDGIVTIAQGATQANWWCPSQTNVASTARTCYWGCFVPLNGTLKAIYMSAGGGLNRQPIDMDIEVSTNGTTWSIAHQLRSLVFSGENFLKLV